MIGVGEAASSELIDNGVDVLLRAWFEGTTLNLTSGTNTCNSSPLGHTITMRVSKEGADTDELL